MKKMKTIFIALGLVALATGAVAFTSSRNGEGDDDKKCKVKIVKIVDGVKTEIDSTFDCSEQSTWVSSLNCMGDSLHKMMKVMMIDGDSGEFDFDFNFEFDENDENGMKVMKIKGGDGEEVEMKFDFKMLDGEDGVMKMMVNGEKLEIKIDEMHKHLDKMKKHMGSFHDENGNIEIMIDSDKDGEEPHSIKITKSVDDDGNVIMKKIVDGEEIEIDEEEMEKMHKKHRMMFIGDDGKMSGNHNVTIDLKVDSKEGKEMKHIVIITKVSSEKEADLAKEFPAAKKDLAKKELPINKLNFSPNPNDGKFDLSFKLAKKEPVQIKIFDVQGKKVYSEKITNFNGKYSKNIDISNNGEGIYLLQIVQGEKASTSKIVIK